MNWVIFIVAGIGCIGAVGLNTYACERGYRNASQAVAWDKAWKSSLMIGGCIVIFGFLKFVGE